MIMKLEDKIYARLKEIEENLTIYDIFIKNPTVSDDDRKVVSFRLLYEMMAFMELKEHSDYEPKESTMVLLSSGLKGTIDYVNIKDRKVVISPEYRVLLKQKEDYMKTKNRN